MEIVGTAVDGCRRVHRRCRCARGHSASPGSSRTTTGNYYSSFRQDIGRAILLGLEFLIAGDIIRTVVVAPTIQNVLVAWIDCAHPHVSEFVAPTGNRRKIAVAPGWTVPRSI